LIFETPNSKQTEIAQREQYELETALAGTPAPPKILPTDEPTSWPPPTPDWGSTTPLAGGGQLFEMDRYLEMRGFFSNNAWSYILNETEFMVIHAGEAIESFDPAYQPSSVQGGIHVGRYSMISAGSDSQDFYPTPTRSGSARLVDALVSGADIWVQVTTTGGDTFVFNVTTRTWEDTTALPTLTPLPDVTPTGSATMVPGETATTPVTTTTTPTPTTTVTPTPQTGAVCAPQPFGAATAFNALILGDLSQEATDTEGRLAVGGNAILSSYGLGRGLTTAADDQDTLIVGGNLTYTNGQVYHGHVAYGAGADLTDVTLLTGDVRADTPLDFAAVATDLQARSQAWAALPATGTTQVEPWGAITLTGNDPERNVFSLAGADLADATALTIQVPADATVLVNVDGTTHQMQNFGIFLEGVAPQQVVYHFPDSERLTIAGIGVLGSIVAPNAAISFPSGNIDGTLIGAGLEGRGELHHYPPQLCLPEPATP
jgi:choice-of-anchor A domain-containing protein